MLQETQHLFFNVFPKEPIAVRTADVITILFCTIYRFLILNSFLDKAINIDNIKKKYVAFPEEKKLPVVLIGKISIKKRKIKGVMT